MAQSILEIYNEMVSEKNTMTTLNGLQPNIDSGQTFLNDITSPAKVACWRTTFFIAAIVMHYQQLLFDDLKTWINNRATEITTGTLPWMVRMTLDFQYGDSLTFINDKYQYATVNEANKIVKVATANEVGGVVVIKTAKFDVDGITPIELDTDELDALKVYLQQIKFAGVRLNVVSRPADLLKVSYRIYFDPLVLSDTGELLSTPGVYPVNDAINNYCKGLPFNGRYTTTELTDLIQQAPGVVDPVHLSTESKYGAFPYVAVEDYYNPNAGYLKVDPLFPLSDTIIYVPAP